MLTLLFLLWPTASPASTLSCTHDNKNFHCVKYIRNYDADTVTFDIPHIHPLIGKNINIRVRGVDTPEIKTKNSCEKKRALLAKERVASLLKNAKRIDLKNITRGKYFRIVADIQIDGKSLADYLLSRDLAYAYDGGRKKKVDWCRPQRGVASEKKNKLD